MFLHYCLYLILGLAVSHSWMPSIYQTKYRSFLGIFVFFLNPVYFLITEEHQPTGCLFSVFVVPPFFFANNLRLLYFSVNNLRLRALRHILSKNCGMRPSPKLRHPRCYTMVSFFNHIASILSERQRVLPWGSASSRNFLTKCASECVILNLEQKNSVI